MCDVYLCNACVVARLLMECTYGLPNKHHAPTPSAQTRKDQCSAYALSSPHTTTHKQHSDLALAGQKHVPERSLRDRGCEPAVCLCGVGQKGLQALNSS